MKDLELKEYRFHQPYLHLSIIVPVQIMNQILEHAFSGDCVEQGGFLIGKYKDENSAVIYGVVSPIRKNSSYCSFIRYTEGMEEFWDALYNDDGYIYLGEWHSHPAASANYSNIDRNTMIEISEADSVGIRYPIFLIIGYSKKSPDIKFYTIKNKIIYSYEQR